MKIILSKIILNFRQIKLHRSITDRDKFKIETSFPIVDTVVIRVRNRGKSIRINK